MDGMVQATITLLALVNPAMCLALFMKGRDPHKSGRNISEAIGAVLAIALILCVAAFAGRNILALFGISLPAFSVAGGLVLAAIGTRMMVSVQAAPDSETSHADASITPLILFAASPGTITGVITIAASNQIGSISLVTLIAIGIVMGILLAVLLAAAKFSKNAKNGGLARQVVTSYMGLIVIAMGVQFALTGFKDFMQA
ncbi:MarC family protein [Erythrobacter sp. JGD-13]|uniref:UPF0056 membrane protein n=2 Tax=Aurantiacibacter sediminis TaxID=2793064 RepID=A0ABS0N5A6_9SPHN|nr:MarC family protein [Aurantiacibacter sediminis]